MGALSLTSVTRMVSWVYESEKKKLTLKNVKLSDNSEMLRKKKKKGQRNNVRNSVKSGTKFVKLEKKIYFAKLL